MAEYYTIQLTEMLHELEEGPYDLPWAVFKKRNFIDGWIADCVNEYTAKILINALNKEEIN